MSRTACLLRRWLCTARRLRGWEGDLLSLALAKRLANSQPWLDRLAKRTQPLVRNLLGRRPWHDLVDGTWLGVPLHPVLTDVPIGAWTTAFVLDNVAGVSGSATTARAADAALAVGTAGAAPAAVTGLGDWRDLGGQSRRIASLHGILNVAGLTLTIASQAQRARGCRTSGRALSTAGLAVSGLAAHLGGELSFGLGVRVNHAPPSSAPTEFTPVLSDDELAAGTMRRVDVGGTAVLLTRDRTGSPCAIANTCSHLGGPLASGERTDDTVTCPWHGSRFDVATGRVVEGPAVYPQPAYETRVRGGTIELRRQPESRPRTTAERPSAQKQAMNQQPSFETDIRPLFRPKDISEMAEAFDLSSYQDVVSNAESIYQRLAQGDMPCDEAWSTSQVRQFRAWMDAGHPH